MLNIRQILGKNKLKAETMLKIFILSLSISFIGGSLPDHTYKAYVTVVPVDDSNSVISSAIQGVTGSSLISSLVNQNSIEVQIALATLDSKVFITNFS